MKGITINELNHCHHVAKVTVHSLDRMLYQVTIQQDDSSRMLIGDDSIPLRFSSILEIRELLNDVEIDQAVLHLPNTYDEMIGRPIRSDATPFEMPLGW